MKNPCISHMIKYTIGWELDGKKGPILWGKYEYQFYRFFHVMGLAYFPMLWEIDRKTHACPIRNSLIFFYAIKSF